MRADYEAGFVELNFLSGTVTDLDSAGIAGANVTLTNPEGTEINTTQTDSIGHYAFKAVAPGFYNLTATKRSYWLDSNPVNVTAEAPTTVDISLCQKGDLNTNSEQADANRRLSKDGRCNSKHNPTGLDIRPEQQRCTGDEEDLTLLKNVSLGVAELEQVVVVFSLAPSHTGDILSEK